nr:glycosyltransferase family 39 protein [cf. Phormidesmis sp. LEGE 11477]
MLFRSIIAYFLPVGFDEAYYFLYTQNLAWSYFDHPPAVAVTTGLGIWLTGIATPLTMRLCALVLFTASLWLLYATGKWLFGPRTGLISCAIASLVPLFVLSFGVLAAPDNALIFFWSLALYLCAREFYPQGCSLSDSQGDSQRNAYSYSPTAQIVLIAIAIGLACLSKYHGFIIGLSLIGFCLTSAPHRVVFRSKWLAYGCVAFGLTLLPLLYWNASHDWISFQFQLGDRFTEYGDDSNSYSFTLLLGAVLAQFGYLFPSMALPLWWAIVKALISQLPAWMPGWRISQRGSQRLGRRTGELNHQSQIISSKIGFLLWSGLPVALGFTLIGGATHTFPAWPASGLWSLVILLGYAASSWPLTKVRRWLMSSALTIGVLLMFALTHITLGTLQKSGDYALLGGVVAIEQDPSTELIDVMQLRRRLDQSAEFRVAIKSVDFVITSRYWLSGYIALAMPREVDLPVSSFTIDPRGYAFWFDPAQWIGKDALFVSLNQDSLIEEVDAIAPYFSDIIPLAQISTRRGGEISETFHLYQAKNLRQPYPYPYGPKQPNTRTT